MCGLDENEHAVYSLDPCSQNPRFLFVKLSRYQVEFYARNLELSESPPHQAASLLFSHD